jgi:hypothetical protein
VWAYSGIGEGATFRCSFGDGSFSLQPVEEDDNGAEISFSHEDLNQDHDETQIDDNNSIGSMESSTQSEDDALDLYLDDVDQWKRETFSDAKELSQPIWDRFQPSNLLTGVKVLGMSSFGDIKTGSREWATRRRKRRRHICGPQH